MNNSIIDFLLLRANLLNPSEEQAKQLASALRKKLQGQFQTIRITYNSEVNIFYAYFYLNHPTVIPAVNPNEFLGELAGEFCNAELSRISVRNPIQGYSRDLMPENRYVVEMDPEAGWEEELFAWYDQEHLSGLAAVPGCVAASHCLNRDHAPYSFAFYDLKDPAVLGCEPWLKIRGTSWSDRVRPHFTNTRRTMFSFI